VDNSTSRSAGPDRKGRCCRSQPRFRSANSALEGVAAADLSPWPRARRLLYVPEAEGTNPAPPTTCSRDRQTDMPARYPVAQLGTVSSRIQIPVSRPAFSNSELTDARSQNLTAPVDYCSSRSLRYSEWCRVGSAVHKALHPGWRHETVFVGTPTAGNFRKGRSRKGQSRRIIAQAGGWRGISPTGNHWELGEPSCVIFCLAVNESAPDFEWSLSREEKTWTKDNAM